MARERACLARLALRGDGRTDVLAVHGARLDVSWAGVSPWTLVAAKGVTVADVAVADFDGDGRADIFAADGTEWTYASAGRTWTPSGLVHASHARAAVRRLHR